MTEIEAIKEMKTSLELAKMCEPNRERQQENSVYELAIKALEKQIPKKPITYKGTNRADCPICGATVRGIDNPFGDWCSKCGQRLLWESEEF